MRHKEEIKQLLNLQASSEVAASILKNEVDELKQTKVEGLSEDPEMRLDFGSISSRGIKHDRQTPTMHCSVLNERIFSHHQVLFGCWKT